jgi:type I restriction enzyme, R subunit
VRQHRRAVEKYREPQAWIAIDDEKQKELIDEIAPLPSSHMLGTEEAKRFDLLMFSLELALLKGSKRFDTLRKQLLEIASALEDQTGIPAIAQHAVLIEEIQTDQWWEGVTVPLLELVRLRLRDLIQHIEKSRKAVVYSDFVDEIGDGVELQLPQVGAADFARFKSKARHFLRAHKDHITLHKLRQGKPLTIRPERIGKDAAKRRHRRSRRYRTRASNQSRLWTIRPLAGWSRSGCRQRSLRRFPFERDGLGGADRIHQYGH